MRPGWQFGRVHSREGRRNEPPLGYGLGLHFGKVLYSNTGSSERLDVTIISDPVNTAALCLEETRVLGTDYLGTDAFVARRPFSPAIFQAHWTAPAKGDCRANHPTCAYRAS